MKRIHWILGGLLGVFGEDSVDGWVERIDRIFLKRGQKDGTQSKEG